MSCVRIFTRNSKTNEDHGQSSRPRVRETDGGDSVGDLMHAGSPMVPPTANGRGIRARLSRLQQATGLRVFAPRRHAGHGTPATRREATKTAIPVDSRRGTVAACCEITEHVMESRHALPDREIAETGSYGVTSKQGVINAASDSTATVSRTNGLGQQNGVLDHPTAKMQARLRRRSTGDWLSRSEMQDALGWATRNALSGVPVQSRSQTQRAGNTQDDKFPRRDGELKDRSEGSASHGSTEKGGETLKDLVRDSRSSLSTKISALYEAFRIVQCLHSAGVMIGTFNLDSIVWCSDCCQWKLANLQNEAGLASRVITSRYNTHEAPELSEARESRDFSRVGKPADMWSLGVIVLEMFTGKEYRHALHRLDHLRQFIWNEIRDLNEDEVDREALEQLLDGLLCMAPEHRLTIMEIPRTKFFERNFGIQQRSRKEIRPHLKSRRSQFLDAGHRFASLVDIRLALRRFRRNADASQSLEKITSRTCSIRDSTLPSETVYTRFIRETTFLQIDLDTPSPMNFVRLEDVILSINNVEEPAELKAVPVSPGGRSLKSIAAIDAKNLTSKELCRPSKWFGSEKDKYTQLKVDFTVVNRAWPGNLRLSRGVRVKVIGRKILLLLDQVPHLCRKATDGLPQCARSICKAGAAFVSCVAIP